MDRQVTQVVHRVVVEAVVLRRLRVVADEGGGLDVARIPLGAANLMVAADLAVGCSVGVLERASREAVVIGNLDLAATAAFKRDPHLSIEPLLHRRPMERATNAAQSVWLHCMRLAERLFGNAHERLPGTIKALRLDPVMETRVGDLSKGYRRRLLCGVSPRVYGCVMHTRGEPG